MLLTIRKQLRNHPALIPLFFFIGGGATMSLLYLARLGLRNPDVSWDRKNNPEPWNKLSPNYQYKTLVWNSTVHQWLSPAPSAYSLQAPDVKLRS
ncbi:NADH dehydrogenase 1 alpha subcomplex subunit 4 ndufa4 [Crenichthys baileyi]|uniref:Cytochrome c oxidase subunit NDUFA4 n=1 Tax=Crenichthys baileyi TaxID=28760 RepID=A0AAV9RJ91_9TELE